MTQVEAERKRWLEMAVVAGLAAVPDVGGPMSVVAAELLDRRHSRVAALGTEVLADHDSDDVLARLRSDERFGELFLRAAETSAMSAWGPKRRAMGRVVVAALDGGGEAVDDGELLLGALEQLDAPHFAALSRLACQTAQLGRDLAGVDRMSVGGLTPPVLAALLATGAATQESGYNGLFVRTSEFGERLLALVQI